MLGFSHIIADDELVKVYRIAELTDDQYIGRGKKRFEEAKKVFERLINHSWFTGLNIKL